MTHCRVGEGSVKHDILSLIPESLMIDRRKESINSHKSSSDLHTGAI